MLDKSFIEGLTALAAKGEMPKLLNLRDDTAVLSVNGTTKEVALPPARRNHAAENLETIFAFAGKFPASSIWYDKDGVVVITDDGDRRDKMTMQLSYSPQLDVLMAWEAKGQAGQILTQREAILMLRTVFKDRLRQHETLISNMRLMKSSIYGGGESKIEQSKRSIDKRLEHQWSGADAIPECITFNVPVFESRFYYESTVEVAIDSNPEKETFTFIPIPGSITSAIEEAEAKIGTNLRTLLPDHERIYYGSPVA